MNLAAVYRQLGEREAASKALRELLILKPDFALEARAELGKWYSSQLVEHVIDGLRKAGWTCSSSKGEPVNLSATTQDTRICQTNGFAAIVNMKRCLDTGWITTTPTLNFPRRPMLQESVVAPEPAAVTSIRQGRALHKGTETI